MVFVYTLCVSRSTAAYIYTNKRSRARIVFAAIEKVNTYYRVCVYAFFQLRINNETVKQSERAERSCYARYYFHRIVFSEYPR